MSTRIYRRRRALAAAAALLSVLHAPHALAQLAACAAIDDDGQRLRCYDDLARRESAGAPSHSVEKTPSAREAAPATSLEREWELRQDLKRGSLNLVPYRPVYALVHVVHWPNEAPASPTRPADAAHAVGLKSVEAKLQLSLKTKLVQNVLGGPGDLWFGYTQQSYWQANNGRYSSPFRETNYEPELMYVHPVRYALGPWTVRYLGASLDHQSNGQARPLSRSWNRLIGDIAAEAGPWTVHLRPWARILVPPADRNDNPDITDYVGRGELVASYRTGRQVWTFTGRHTLRGGDASRGSARLDWAFPLAGGLNGHVQLFSGYGDSLIDYNHRQTALGIGLSFFD
jgi:phospholipase A1